MKRLRLLRGRLLKAIQTLQLDGQLTTKEEALAWIQKHAPVADVFEGESTD